MTSPKPKSLHPIQVPDESPGLERAILALLRHTFYIPLINILYLPRKVLNNANTPEDAQTLLRTAIADGRVSLQMRSGDIKLVGAFSAETSKYLLSLGATYSPKSKSFKLPATSTPRTLWDAANEYRNHFHAALRALDAQLARFNPDDIAQKIDTEKYFTRSLQETHSAFVENTKGLEKRPEVSAEALKASQEQYKANVERSIKDFTADETKKLREMVDKHLAAGGSSDELVEPIRVTLMRITGESYDRAQNRAKFIAAQETKLAMSAFVYEQYIESNYSRYRWWSHANARPYHLALHGTIHDFKNPPITDAKGRRNNPGEDFGPCKCKAIPIRD